MALRKRFRGHSRKKSSAGTAFDKRGGGHKMTSIVGKFGDTNFLKRLLGKAGKDIEGRNSSGLIELILMAQLGDMNAIQLLNESGVDAKDNLGLASLVTAALTGDMDAARLLEGRGVALNAKKDEEETDHYTAMMIEDFGDVSYAVAEYTGEVPAGSSEIRNTEDTAPVRTPRSTLKKALSAVGKKDTKVWHVSSEHGKSLQERPVFTPTNLQA